MEKGVFKLCLRAIGCLVPKESRFSDGGDDPIVVELRTSLSQFVAKLSSSRLVKSSRIELSLILIITTNPHPPTPTHPGK